MNNGRLPSVQELQPLQDLPPPVTNHLGLDGFQSSHVTGFKEYQDYE